MLRASCQGLEMVMYRSLNSKRCPSFFQPDHGEARLSLDFAKCNPSAKRFAVLTSMPLWHSNRTNGGGSVFVSIFEQDAVGGDDEQQL
jgi:hypothetical protein